MIGPVLTAELLTTSRRRRYYAGRLFYGLVLLFVLWSNYVATFGVDAGGTTFGVDRMVQFSNTMLSSLTIAQLAAVALLTPAMVSGVIASETQRKTLHYLLASELTSTGIVLGKLLARMLHVAVYLAIGLPVVSLMTLFGGVDPLRVLGSFALALTFAYFLACLCMLASTIAGRVRGAVMLGYAFALAWPFLPGIIGFLLAPLRSDRLMEVLKQAFLWAYPGGMLTVASAGWVGFGVKPAGLDSLPGWAVWAIGVAQLLLWGTGFLALTAARLRPLSQRRESKARVVIGLDKQGRHRLRVLPRPPVGADPMMWKERHTSRAGGVARLLMSTGALAGFVLIGCVTFDAIQRALGEIRADWWEDVGRSTGRGEFNLVLRGLTALIGFVWLLGTAVTAAGGVAGEREEDTWLSLTATPLTGWEILRAKMVGAVLRFRSLAWTLAILWGLGLATGSIHPAGVLLDVAVLGSALACVAALGTYHSLRSASVLKALSATVLWLLVANAGILVDVMPIGQRLGHLPQLSVVTSVLSQSTLSYQDVGILLKGADPATRQSIISQTSYGYGYSGSGIYLWQADWLRATVIAAAVVSLLYALGAVLFASLAVRTFDRLADRPRRARLAPSQVSATPAPAAASTAPPTAAPAG